ncbi:MAG: cupin domain-containing protein [Candidatus Acidiferrales bacterium]
MKNLRCVLLGVLLTTLLLLITTGTALAQDAVKVSPETHKVLLENDQVRVLDARMKPGEKIAMHSHPANVVYFLTDGKIKITYPDGKTEVREVKAGVAAWNEGVTHAAENVGATEFHELQIELKGPAKKPAIAEKKTM